MRTALCRAMFAATLLATLLLAACAAPNRPPPTLYQTATIDALMDGVFDGHATVAQLLRHGDFGIGTFDALDGELVIVDGKCYRVGADGNARTVSAAEQSPFAMVTFFQTDRGATAGEADLAALEQVIDQLSPERNLFCAVRVEGLFAQVRTRSVPRQEKPYPKLIEVTAHQPTFDLSAVRGTLVGFRCPYFVKGMNVPGYHFHFITSDLSRGGHVLSCRLAAGVVRVQVISEFQLSLPRDPVFAEAKFSQKRPGELEQVEKGRE